MISYEFRQFLNEKIIENLPHSFKRIGDKYNGRCPFCGDSKKSSTKARGWIYLQTSTYHCFNCGLTLSGMKFLQMISGSRFSEIKHQYMRMFVKSEISSAMDINIEYEEPKEIDFFNIKSIINPDWKNPLSNEAIDYLKNRKVLEAPFLKENFYSTYSKAGKEYILIPWTLSGVEGAYYQLNDFKKNGSLKYIFPKDEKKLIYGLDNIDPLWPFIICFEGVFDSIFVKNGICTGTKSITSYQLDIIKKRFPRHQIVISFDNDISGILSMKKMIMSGYDFKFFKWFNRQTQQKDINDYILFKNDVNIFTKEEVLERMIVSPMKMKLHLVENQLWSFKNKDDKSKPKPRKISKQ